MNYLIRRDSWYSTILFTDWPVDDRDVFRSLAAAKVELLVELRYQRNSYAEAVRHVAGLRRDEIVFDA